MVAFTASTASCISVTPAASATVMLSLPLAATSASCVMNVMASGFTVESSTVTVSVASLLSPSASVMLNLKLSLPSALGFAV